jgi:hypothetical protein
MNEAHLLEGFENNESGVVRRAFWGVLFPRLKALGWSMKRETEYNFGAYTFYRDNNSLTKQPMKSISDVLKVAVSVECCQDAVKGFYSSIEQHKLAAALKQEDRKRKHLDEVIAVDERKKIGIGVNYQVRSLPRAGTHERGSSNEYIHSKLWSPDDSSANNRHDILHDVEESMKWKDATKDDSFRENFHKAVIESNKEISFVASKLGITVGSCLWYYYNRYKPSNNYNILKCHIRKLQMEQTRNHDECAICDDGGELLCCDTCPHAYHLRCLGQSSAAPLDDEESWSCPICVRKRTESCRSPAKSPKKMNARMSCSSLPTHSSQLFIAKEESDRFVSDNTLALARNISLPQVDDETNFAPSKHSMFSYKAEDPVLKAKTKYDYGDRYSSQNVAARIQGDGTVLPVTLKKLPNGEFARPIGRQRKGMTWDGVRGAWVLDLNVAKP